MPVHAPATPGLAQIGQIALAMKDLPRAVAFYRDVLGLPFLFEAPPKLAFFDCAGVRLMLSEPEKPEFDHPASILYYRVRDIDAAHASLAAKVHFEAPPRRVHRDAQHELWLAVFRDSEGNPLALFSERPAG